MQLLHLYAFAWSLYQLLEVAYCLRLVRFVRLFSKIGAINDIFEALAKSSQAMSRAFIVFVKAPSYPYRLLLLITLCLMVLIAGIYPCSTFGQQSHAPFTAEC